MRRVAGSGLGWRRERTRRRTDQHRIPKDSVLRYETAIRANKFLLIVHGTSEELTRAKDILANTDAASVEQTHATL
jgi:hypothetical protein